MAVTPPGNDGPMTTELPITISCDSCIMRRTDHCHDCVVTHLCAETEEVVEGVVLDLAEVRALRLLVDAGMVPSLKHREAI